MGRVQKPNVGRRDNPEEREQVALVTWARLHERMMPDLALLHSSLNGVKLPYGIAIKAKRSGMLKGVPDLFLPIPGVDGSAGMFIEMKASKGVLSPEQKWFRDRVAGTYSYIVCRDWTEGANAICKHLGAMPQFGGKL